MNVLTDSAQILTQGIVDKLTEPINGGKQVTWIEAEKYVNLPRKRFIRYGFLSLSAIPSALHLKWINCGRCNMFDMFDGHSIK